MLTKTFLKELVYRVNGAAIAVHKELGPGLLESVYQKCLKKEFSFRQIRFQSEIQVPINYKGWEIDTALRCDFLIEDILVLELKAVEFILPVHEAQVITYMKLLKAPQSLIINFNVTHIFKEGQESYVSDLYRNLPE